MRIPENRRPALVFLCALLTRLALIPVFDFALDDAYITFRVARNIGRGWGMVFHQGEPVLSVTTPLYALLMVPGELLGMGAPLWSKLLNSVAAALAFTILYLILRERVRKGLSATAVYYLILSPFAAFMALTGMESSFLCFLILAAAYFYLREKGWSLGLVLGLCVLTRPEGAIASVVFFAAVLAFKRKLWLRTALPAVLMGVPWLLYSHLTFGSVIPNSYIAKQAYFSVCPMSVGAHLASYYRYLCNTVPVAPLLILLFPLGAWRIVARERELLPIGAWVLIVAATQIFSSFYLAHWYLDMLTPAIFVIMLLGIEQLLERVLPGLGKLLKKRKVTVAVAALLLLNNWGVFWLNRHIVMDLREMDRHMGAIADWFVRNEIPRERNILIEAIGRVGYDTDARILDMFGLVSPEVAAEIAELRGAETQLVGTFRPYYFVTGADIPPQSLFGYTAVAAIPQEQLSRRPVHTVSYIYGRPEPGPFEFINSSNQ